MRNFVQPGETVPFNAAADVASGEAVLVGALFGVSSGAVKSGKVGQARRTGVFDLPKTTSQAWTAWAKVYWDATNKKVTTTAASNTLIGLAFQAQGSADTVGRVLLTGQVA